MSYNCFIKSRSAFLLLFGGEMTSGLLCSVLESESRRKRKQYLHRHTEMKPAKICTPTPESQAWALTGAEHEEHTSPRATLWPQTHSWGRADKSKSVAFVKSPTLFLICADVYWTARAFLYVMHTRSGKCTQKTQDKGRNLTEDWFQNEESCYHSKQRTSPPNSSLYGNDMQPLHLILMQAASFSQLSIVPFVVWLFLCFDWNQWNYHGALKLHTTSKPSHLGWLIQFRKQ